MLVVTMAWLMAALKDGLSAAAKAYAMEKRWDPPKGIMLVEPMVFQMVDELVDKMAG